MSTNLVCTHLLHRVHVFYRQIKASKVRLETGESILEVRGGPLLDVRIGTISLGSVAGIRTPRWNETVGIMTETTENSRLVWRQSIIVLRWKA